MSLIGNIVNGFRSGNTVDGDDEYYLDDDYLDEGGNYDDYDDYDEPPRAKNRLFSKIGGRSAAQDEEQGGKAGIFGGRSKIIQMNNSASNMEVTMKKPTSFNDSKEIVDELLAGKAVVINLEGISSETASRIFDFTCGAVYSIDGDIRSISKYIYMASPHSVELTGEFAAEFGETRYSGSAQDNHNPSGRSSGRMYGVSG